MLPFKPPAKVGGSGAGGREVGSGAGRREVESRRGVMPRFLMQLHGECISASVQNTAVYTASLWCSSARHVQASTAVFHWLHFDIVLLIHLLCVCLPCMNIRVQYPHAMWNKWYDHRRASILGIMYIKYADSPPPILFMFLRFWWHAQPTGPPEDLTTFLNESLQVGEGKAGDLHSIWSAARDSLANTGATLRVLPNSTTLYTEWCPIGWSQRKLACQLLKGVGSHRLARIKSNPDQGRAFDSICLHPDSTFFTYTGAYTLMVQACCHQQVASTQCCLCERVPETLATTTLGWFNLEIMLS